MNVPGFGSITWHPRGVFIATCSRPGHESCSRTRSAVENSWKGSGRTCGHLLAWLKDPRGTDKTSHEQIKGKQLRLAMRETERENLAALEHGQTLLDCEEEVTRDCREPAEPPIVT